MPATATQRRDLTTRSFHLRASSIDEESRSVEAIVVTETATPVFDWSRWGVVDEVLRLDGMTFGEQVPLLESHRRYSIETVLGSIRDLKVEGKNLVGRLFFDDDELAERAWNKVKNGHLTDVSAGYRVIKSETLKPYERKTVNGVKYEAGKRPLRIATASRLREGSLVPIGADEGAKIRDAEASAFVTREISMNNELRKYLESLGLRATADEDSAWAFFNLLDGDQKKRAEELKEGKVPTKTEPEPEDRPAVPPADPKRTGEPGDKPDAGKLRDEAIKAERKRQTELRELAGEDVSPELLQRAIDEGWDAERAAAAFLKDVRDNRPPAISLGHDHREDFTADVVRGICLGLGEQFEGQELERAQRFAGIGLRDIARLCLQHERRELPVGVDMLARAAVSTGTFPTLLGTAATKALHRAYNEYPSTFASWAGTRDVSDFKSYSDIKLSAFATSADEEIGDGGEIPHATLSEAAETYQAKTYGFRFALTRKYWFNDDLGGFMRIPMQMGLAAARQIDTLGYNLLVSNSGVGPTMSEDSQALFYASRTTPNYKTGAAASALDDTGMKNAKTLMRKIVGLASENLNIIPRYLLVPPELEHAALKLVQSQEIMVAKAGDTDATTYLPTKNIHRGTLMPIVEPRLSAATNGTTAWYIIAEPNQASSLVIVYLRGNRTPVIERNDPPDVLGIGWRIYHDVGVAALDWRGIVRSKGA